MVPTLLARMAISLRGKALSRGALHLAERARLAVLSADRAAALSLLLTIVFFIQHLKNGGRDAGFLYSGDVLGYYWPALVKLHDLFWNHTFVAIDFSSYNGSSAFLLTANLNSVHPLVVLPALVLPTSITFEQTGYWLVLMVAFHSFLASYYAHRLMCDFFGFRFGLGAMVGALFGFSSYFVGSAGEPTFIFSIAVLPWIAHAALHWAQRPSLARLLWAMLPVIFALLGGYGPLGLAGVGFAVCLVLMRTLALEEFALRRERLRLCAVALVPTLCVVLLLSPYLYLMLRFHGETGSASSPSLFYSAFQLAEAPQSILRMISPHLKLSGKSYEFSPVWGIAPLCIAMIFVFGYRTFEQLTVVEQKLFYFCATAYVVSVLAIYGVYSPVSNLIFHLVPVIGKMHIYQRFLLATGLFSAIIVALMVKAVEAKRPQIATRLVLAGCGALTCVLAYVVSDQPGTAQLMRADNYLVFELIVATLVVLIFFWPSRGAVYAAVTSLLFLVPLGQIYNYSQLGNTLTAQKTRVPLQLDPYWKDTIVTYIRQRSPKMLNKYVDMSPFWTPEGIESFPKSFPYFVQHDLDLSSYGGFSFYLSGRKAYTDRMPVRGETVALEPNWELIAAQGGDFVVAPVEQIGKGALDRVASADDIADALLLPNNLKLVPLHSQRKRIDAERGTVYNNGYYRVRLEPVVEPASLVNMSFGKLATQSGGGNAGLAVDGNTDGNYANGSVSHTGNLQHAWLEVDLGAAQIVENVLVWNRTDCCADRLKNYWIFLSEEPFDEAATPAELTRSPRVWSRSVTSAPSPSQQIDVGGRKARYVRVQLSGNSPLEASFLALAELQVFGRTTPASTTGQNEIKVEGFNSNRANDIWIVFTTAKSMSIDYLLSDNPNLTFELNGERIFPILSHDTLTFNIPAGRHHFRAIYRDQTLVAFWILYGVYFAALVTALAWSFWTRSRARPAVA